MLVAQYETMTFQRDRKTVCGRSCQSGCGNQLSERCRAGFERVEDFDGLIEHPYAGMNFVAAYGRLIGLRCFGFGAAELWIRHDVLRVR